MLTTSNVSLAVGKRWKISIICYLKASLDGLDGRSSALCAGDAGAAREAGPGLPWHPHPPPAGARYTPIEKNSN